MSLIISNSKDLVLDESLVTKLQSAYKNISFDEGLRDSSRELVEETQNEQ